MICHSKYKTHFKDLYKKTSSTILLEVFFYIHDIAFVEYLLYTNWVIYSIIQFYTLIQY
mgnify:CR=1 FL=1